MGNEQQQQGAGTETVDAQTTAVDVHPTRSVATTTPATANSEPAGADLGKVRELVLKAHPDVVPDLVRGGSVDELIASVEPARTAYQRIANQIRGSNEGGRRTADGNVLPPPAAEETTAVVQPPVVPAGGASNVADPGDLAPTTKIARALAAREKR